MPGTAQITSNQLELLKSFRYLRNDEQISEVKELLHLYYRHKLDAAIDKAESSKGLTATVYEAWLSSQKD